MAQKRSFFMLMMGFISGAVLQAEGSTSDQRKVLVAVIGLSEMANKYLKLYRNEEQRAKQITELAGSVYDQVEILQDSEATLPRFAELLLKLEKDPNVGTIDTVIYLHGEPGQVCFNGTGRKLPDCTSQDEIQSYFDQKVLNPLGSRALTKTRALYSDACYGATSATVFLNLGYKVYSGSLGTDQNRAGDYRIFMKYWLKGRSYEEAIARANRYWLTPYLDALMRGDSKKHLYGNGALVF
jgi:hypothetical protein